MKKRFLYKCSLLFVMFCGLITGKFNAFAQNITAVNLTLQPPYSGNYATYENLANHAIITIIGGMQPMNVHLTGKLTNTQTGLTISTNRDFQSTPFRLAANQTITLINDGQKMRFLNRNQVTVSGVSEEQWTKILQDGSLPEGQYSLCVNVIDDSTARNVGTACTNFSITYAQAPVITTPIDNQKLDANLPNTVFSWTPPIGNTLGAQIVYDLYVVKVPVGQNPNDVMNAAVDYKANNPIIKTNLTANQYVTQPSDLKIDTGARYAVQVVARDAARKVSFKNQGRSEVVTFTKGSGEAVAALPPAILQMTPKPRKSIGYTVTNIDPVPLSEIKGKLYYKFKDADHTAAEIGGAGQANPQMKAGAALNKKSYSPDDLVYNTDNISKAGARPLAGKRISLVVTYLLTGDYRNESVKGQVLNLGKQILPPKEQDQYERVLATTTTSTDGSFTFKFVNAQDSLGLINNNFAYATGGEFGYRIQGQLYKVLRIKVNDKYFLSPDVNINIDPWKGLDIGTVVSFVKSYSLKVKVTTTSGRFWDMAYGQSAPLAGISTRLKRKTQIAGIPDIEGPNEKKPIPTTDKDGYVTFRHLVQYDPGNPSDRYYIECDPGQNSGNFSFKQTEKSYYPSRFKGNFSNFPFNSQRTYIHESNDKNNLKLPIPYGEDITWNHELQIKTYTDSVELYPTEPRIAGKLQVARDVEARSLSNVMVTMLSTYVKSKYNSKPNIQAKTDVNGRYQFNNLPVETGEFNYEGPTKIIGPTRRLLVVSDGFKNATLPGAKQSDSLWKKQAGSNPTCKGCYPPLKFGQQLLNQDFFLTPDGKLAGYVVDENGDAVEAEIDVDGYTKSRTKPIFAFDKGSGANTRPGGLRVMTPSVIQQSFEMLAPSGNRKVTITPSDRGYATKDTLLNIKKNASASAIRFVVLKKRKRVRFRIAEKPAGPSFSNMRLMGATAKPIAGATVTLDIPAKKISQVSDKDGYVTFVFDNAATSFHFLIAGPQNANYEDGSYTLNNVQDVTATKTYGDAWLSPAASISGSVTYGTENKPARDVKIYINIGNGNQIETSTGDDGKYTLQKVPISTAKITVWAARSKGSPALVTTSSEMVANKEKNNLDFHLAVEGELIIENVFGFDAEITSKTKQGDGTWLVSGNLVNLTSNENFSLKTTKQTIPFYNIPFKKSGQMKDGVPVGTPKENAFATDLASIELIFQNAFGVVQRPSSGDKLVVSSEAQQGAITGKIGITKSSLSFSTNYLSFDNAKEEIALLTDKPGSFNTSLASVTSGKMSKKKYGLSNLSGKAVSFQLLGFEASADADKSWIEDNSMHLFTKLLVKNIPGMSSPLEIDAGELLIHPDKLDPLKNDKPMSFKIENWTVVGNTWQLMQNSSGIAIPAGTLKTGSVDIPLKDILIKPDHLGIAGFDVENLSMAGILPVKVLTKSPVFGYNKSIGKDIGPHYEFRLIGEEGQPGVSISSLPGMKPGDAIRFQNMSLVSNGEQILNPGNQPTNTIFYSIMNVRPIAFSSGADYVNMDCGIDLGIPQLEEMSGVIRFTKEAGAIKLQLFPLNVSLHGPGGVDFTANVQFNDHPQEFAEGRFTALGTLHDKEGIVLKAKLNKTVNAAWIKVEPENQTLPLGAGNSALADVKGSMDADMAARVWKNFSFSGTMKGFKGMEGDTRKTFVVTGAINASNQKVEVKNIPTGFGNIGLTYDIANSRFIGNLQVDKNIGPLSMRGTANLLVDAAGWYFLAGGKLSAPGLGDMSAGLLIGNYSSMAPEIPPTLMQFAYDKHLPPNLQHGVSGFFFTGMKTLPVLNIPDYSINLGILSASFGAQAGVDARLWMDFAKAGNEYGIGAMIFAYAYLNGAAITCTKFGAEARAELGVKGTYASSTGAFSLRGCGSFTISGSISQCFPTPCWDGICCTGCIGVSKSAGIKIDFLFDSHGNTDFSFGFGNCSGQSTMSGNW